MRNLPVGIQTFSDIILNNYLYVDKTEKIYSLIKNPKGVYFLSRPRRFGKSLLISTLDDLFKGKKKLFKDLWIAKTDYRWNSYPVIRLDFSKKSVEKGGDLKGFIVNQLNTIAGKYGVALEQNYYDEAFDELIAKLSRTGKVVILVDEYDKPIIDNLGNLSLAAELRNILKGFYTIIKANDEYIRFVLVTGISKFSKAGIFSGLNNLEDISMDGQYSTLLGIAESELVSNFEDEITRLAETERLSKDEIIRKTAFWYNGFCFGKSCEKVYNPFSVLLLYKKMSFSNYWFESGTPQFLVRLIKEKDFDIQKADMMEVREEDFSTYDLDDLSIVPLLFQTGYLTIKGYDSSFMTYSLGYPNFEVKNSFQYALLKSYSHVETNGYLIQLIKSLRKDDFDGFFNTLRIFFANIPYDLQIEKEKYYQTIFYLVFSLVGLQIEAEVKTNIGRVDAVIIDKAVYIFEFKFGSDKTSALNQIKEKRYYEKYLDYGKEIYLFGVDFRDRNIGEWTWEKLKNFVQDH